MANQLQAADDLSQRGAFFIRRLDVLEPQLVAIAREFDGIAAKYKATTDGAKKVSKVGAAAAVVGLGVAVVGLVAAAFTEDGNWVAAVGAITAGAGVIAAISAKLMQFFQKSGNGKDLERLGDEFLTISRPLDEELKGIKTAAHRLRVEAAEGHLLDRAWRVHDVLQRVDDDSGAIKKTTAFGQDLVQAALKLLHHTPPDDQEDQLTRIESSEQCWNIIERFRRFREELQGPPIRGAICG